MEVWKIIFLSKLASWWFQPLWKNISQIGDLPQIIEVKIKNIWNHHLVGEPWVNHVNLPGCRFSCLFFWGVPWLSRWPTSAKISVCAPPRRSFGGSGNLEKVWSREKKKLLLFAKAGTKNLLPGSLTVRPWKSTIPKGEACLPTIIFQGRAVKLRGCRSVAKGLTA